MFSSNIIIKFPLSTVVVNAEFQSSMYNVSETAELLVLGLMANATSSFVYSVSLTILDRSTGE